MGQLKPGATLIYEHVDGVTYAREAGSTQRQEVGMTLEAYQRRQGMQESQLWYLILQQAKTNPALHQALERAKIIYYLSRP